MSSLKILNHTGHTTVEWDAKQAGTGDIDAQAAVDEALRIFAEHKAKGFTPFKSEPNKPAVRIIEFDPTAEVIIMVPRVAGG